MFEIVPRQLTDKHTFVSSAFYEDVRSSIESTALMYSAPELNGSLSRAYPLILGPEETLFGVIAPRSTLNLVEVCTEGLRILWLLSTADAASRQEADIFLSASAHISCGCQHHPSPSYVVCTQTLDVVDYNRLRMP